MDLVVEQVKEVIPQYLEQLPLVVVLVEEIIIHLLRLVIQEDLVVEEHIKLQMVELEILHLLVHLREILVVMVDGALAAVAVVLAVVEVLEKVNPLVDLVVEMVEVEQVIQ